MAKKLKTELLETICDNANVEVFYVNAAQAREIRQREKASGVCSGDSQHMTLAGWYYWTCSPGCLPDSDAFGPFRTFRAAALDAIETFELTQVTPR